MEASLGYLSHKKEEKEEADLFVFSTPHNKLEFNDNFLSFSQRCVNGFRIYDKEENFLNSNEKRTLSDKSLKHEEAIFWTKGEILGRGAYGTVSPP